MPAAINTALDGDNIDRIVTECGKQNREMQILTCFSRMSEDIVKNFPHTKRVGNYLVGRMINKGSFAKVMEGMHIPTGQKVWHLLHVLLRLVCIGDNHTKLFVPRIHIFLEIQ